MSLIIRGKAFRKRDGWWLDYTTPEGHRVRTPGGPTKGEAETLLAKIRTEYMEKGVFEVRREPRVGFEAAAAEYVAWAQEAKRSARRSAVILRRLSKSFKGKCLCDITVAMVERFKAERSKEQVWYGGKTVSPREVNYSLAVLKALFNWAIRRGMATKNPVTQVAFFKVRNARDRYLSKEELQRLLEATQGVGGHLQPVITVAAYTGMRLGEILALRWADIDYPHKVIRIRNSKNGEARVAYLTEPVREALRSCIGMEQVTKPTEDYVFRNRLGQPYRDIREAFGRALERAGITNFKFHDLRHTFASHVANLPGADLMVLQKLLGHKTPSMTQRYAHLFPNRARDAAEQLARNFGTHTAPEGAGEVSK